jgi:hypothetical protein
MPSSGFEPTIPATKQQQSYASDCVATRIGSHLLYKKKFGILIHAKIFKKSHYHQHAQAKNKYTSKSRPIFIDHK